MKKALHMLVIPFPTKGHVNPMLNLSAKLAASGVVVTFVLSRTLHDGMIRTRAEAGVPAPQELGLDLRFLVVPDAFPPDIIMLQGQIPDRESFAGVLRCIRGQRSTIEEAIAESKKSNGNGPPISCVLADCFLDWVKDMADNLHMPRVFVATSGATYNLYLCWLVATGKLLLGEDASNNITFPGVEALTAKEIQRGFPVATEGREHLTNRLGGIEGCQSIVVNSFKELEAPILECVTLGSSTSPSPPVRFLGPMLPLSFFGDTRPVEASIGASFLKEDPTCLQWLDAQAHGSVLYISFGSAAGLSIPQLERVAQGVEASGHRFLWVIRSSAKQPLPEGFQGRTCDRGLVISWAPQVRVLNHPAIGGFLSHCGWNSTMESICAGVPMLCLPIFAEQPINSVLLSKQWKLALSLEEDPTSHLVEKVEVEAKVKALFKADDVRAKVQEWKGIARKAMLDEEGSLNKELHGFIHDLEEATQNNM